MEDIVSCEFQGGQALLDLEAGEYFKLNKTAAFLWEKLSVPSTLEALVIEITNMFDIEPEVCRGDIANILQKLFDAKLIEHSDEAAA